MMEHPRIKQLIVPFGLFLNVISSIGIIQINKYLYVEYNFPNMTLTFLHFIITFLGLLICRHFNVYKHVSIPIVQMLPMAASFCGFVVLTNVSLQLNAIGTYQCLKTMTIPGVMLICIFYYKHTYSLRVKLSVIPVLLGIFFNSMYDLSFNVDGLTVGLIGAAITSLYQVWIGEKQKEFKVNALQLLVYQAPLSALMLALIIPFFEPVYGENSLFDRERAMSEWLLVLVSGVTAFVVNLSIYWVIGTTSALTYNMAGNVKFSLIIIVGSIIFDDKITSQQAVAIVAVTTGLILYTYFKIKEAEAEKKVTVAAGTTMANVPLLPTTLISTSAENNTQAVQDTA